MDRGPVKRSYFSVLIGFAAFGCMNPCLALQHAQSAISDWSIQPSVLGRVEPPRDPPDCAICPKPPECLQSLPTNSDFKYYSLMRPGAANSVAIVKLNQDGSIELNPNGFDYGPIPPLNKMTQHQADQLWGRSVSDKTAKRRTYVLKAFNDTTDSDFILDVTFNRGYLYKYRIRRIGLVDSKWHHI